MIYENALLEALKVCNGKKIQKDKRKSDKYWRKIIKIELKRVRKGHMTSPWLNSAMRYWKNVNKWEDITNG